MGLALKVLHISCARHDDSLSFDDLVGLLKCRKFVFLYKEIVSANCLHNLSIIPL